MNTMNTRLLLLIPAMAALLLPSCSTDPHINAAQTRGAVGGTAIGAIVGNNSGGIGQGEAMLAGAAIGALVGENRARQSNPNLVGTSSVR